MLLLHFCISTTLAVLTLIQKRLLLVLLHYFYYYLKNIENLCLPFRLQKGSSLMAVVHTMFVNCTLFAFFFSLIFFCFYTSSLSLALKPFFCLFPNTGQRVVVHCERDPLALARQLHSKDLAQRQPLAGAGGISFRLAARRGGRQLRRSADLRMPSQEVKGLWVVSCARSGCMQAHARWMPKWVSPFFLVFFSKCELSSLVNLEAFNFSFSEKRGLLSSALGFFLKRIIRLNILNHLFLSSKNSINCSVLS